MDTATALVISLVIISILTILILIIVNVRIYLVKKKYGTKKGKIDLNIKNLSENNKDDLNDQKNSIINVNKNIDNQLILEKENDYYSYFDLLSLNEIKKALMNLEINFNEEQSKEELISLLLKELQSAESKNEQ